MDSAFRYLEHYKDESEADYPYHARVSYTTKIRIQWK